MGIEMTRIGIRQAELIYSVCENLKAYTWLDVKERIELLLKTMQQFNKSTVIMPSDTRIQQYILHGGFSKIILEGSTKQPTLYRFVRSADRNPPCPLLKSRTG